MFVTGFIGTFATIKGINFEGLPPDIIKMLEAIISMLGGLLSAVIVWFLNRLVQKSKDKNELEQLRKELSNYREDQFQKK